MRENPPIDPARVAQSVARDIAGSLTDQKNPVELAKLVLAMTPEQVGLLHRLLDGRQTQMGKP